MRDAATESIISNDLGSWKDKISPKSGIDTFSLPTYNIRNITVGSIRDASPRQESCISDHLAGTITGFEREALEKPQKSHRLKKHHGFWQQKLEFKASKQEIPPKETLRAAIDNPH